MSAPPAYALAAILGPASKIVRHVDIYEEDAVTPYLLDAPFLSGGVNIDMARSERRTVDLVLDNSDDQLPHKAGEFWYDKIIKPYRGVEYVDEFGDDTVWETSLGEFMIDGIQSQDFPHTISVQGRDYTKKLLTSKFKYATAFTAGSPVLDTIKTIAQNGGIQKFILPASGGNLGVDYTFESNTERWKAINDIATAFGYEVYFDPDGYLVVREYQDPITSPIVFTFEIGPLSNVASWKKTSSDSRLYNVVIAKGESSSTIPYSAVASNTEPSSPTNIDEIGERVYEYSSAFITTEEQAQTVANNFLKVMALEEFNIDIGSIVLPWLEAGNIIQFDDETGIGPTEFLLSSMTVPLTLGTMSTVGKRVTIVG